MRRRFVLAAAALTLVVLLALLVWQGSFSFSFLPSNVGETIVLSAVSTVLFLLAVTLAFMLFRAGVKMYLDRQRDREGSRIGSKLLLGALALTLAPTLFATLFNYAVLNRTLEKWFTQPARGIEMNLQALDKSYRAEAAERVQAQADWLSLLPQVRDAAEGVRIDTAFFRQVCEQRGIRQLILNRPGGIPILLYQDYSVPAPSLVQATADISGGGDRIGSIQVASSLNLDPAEKENLIQRYLTEQQQLGSRKKFYQDTYYLLICVLTLFVLFFAAWSAQLLSRHISVPISALLRAAQEVRRGNLSARVRVVAIDELATLVRAFNEMTGDLESNARELEARRRFTEAILQSIPTGVISVSPDGHIERVNRALAGILGDQSVRLARRLEDLFSGEDLREIRYLLKRARRTGAAACQLDLQHDSSVLHLAVTAASLNDEPAFFSEAKNRTNDEPAFFSEAKNRPNDEPAFFSEVKNRPNDEPALLIQARTMASQTAYAPGEAKTQTREQRGFVMVIEDTSDLLRAQKAIAWQEVARRIAHEIKNPLTPISLCADRIARQLIRVPLEPEAREILNECVTIIQQEVQTVKSLVDEFSQFSRFPTAQPVPADLNEIVESAKAVFAGRLEGIDVSYDLDPRLPLVMADREQMKRVIVNLIDNAAEAMSESPVRKLLIATSSTPDVVELSVTDTGSGVSLKDKEKLFLPYFSTKERGTGLGLAIVSRIVMEHHGRVRVEDNLPGGTRFVIELNPLSAADTQSPVQVQETGPATLKV